MEHQIHEFFNDISFKASALASIIFYFDKVLDYNQRGSLRAGRTEPLSFENRVKYALFRNSLWKLYSTIQARGVVKVFFLVYL